jgi:hypothetical protein
MEIRISIRLGIAPERRDKIFGSTTKNSGSESAGNDLPNHAVANGKTICEQPGKGTAFILRFPWKGQPNEFNVIFIMLAAGCIGTVGARQSRSAPVAPLAAPQPQRRKDLRADGRSR